MQQNCQPEIIFQILLKTTFKIKYYYCLFSAKIPNSLDSSKKIYKINDVNFSVHLCHKALSLSECVKDLG